MIKNKRIFPTTAALCHDAAVELSRLSTQLIEENDEFNLFLAGGSTPKEFYKLLATPAYAKTQHFGKMHIYFGDERSVPPDHQDSNFNMVNNALFKNISIDPTRIHRIQSELEPETAAKIYNTTVSALLPKTESGSVIADLVLLGLGPDGHVASLFPDTDILDNTTQYVSSVWVEKLDAARISITYDVINNARNIWFFVTGENKQDIVDRIVNHPSHTDLLPVERIQPKGSVIWFMDDQAAAWVR